MRAVPGLIQMELFIQLILAYVGKKQNSPTIERLTILVAHGGGWESAMRIVIVKQGQTHTFEVSVDTVSGVLDLQHETPSEECNTPQRGEQNAPLEVSRPRYRPAGACAWRQYWPTARCVCFKHRSASREKVSSGFSFPRPCERGPK